MEQMQAEKQRRERKWENSETSLKIIVYERYYMGYCRNFRCFRCPL